MDKEIMSKKVFLSTYGCQMNEYDSELVRAILGEAGYSFVENDVEADIVLLNTCSVRGNAHRKVYGQIHEIRHRRQGKPVIMGILGCMATGLREELLKNKSLALDLVVGPDSYKRLPQILKDVAQGRSDGYDVTLSEFETYSDVYPTRVEGLNAWVAVMRGCNNFCSFCIVPFTRGRERSRSVESVVAEVKRLADEGFPQVTLLGQNVNSYLYEEHDFSYLLEQIAVIKGIQRIRFTSPHPKDFPESLIRVIADNPKVCKQVHLPIQSGSDRVLKLMNRDYTAADFLALGQKLRKACPTIALSTDVIVGFPTETEAEFEDTLNVIREVKFDYAFMFKYSPRPNTEAVRKLKDDVPEKVKTERIVQLNMLQTDISLEKNKALVGQLQPVLVECVERVKGGPAYARNDANKIVVLPPSNPPYKVGDLVHARITRATPHQLKAEVE
jgi:tRNA-2-methylthio-N6-dimethylallyladenosine synthase